MSRFDQILMRVLSYTGVVLFAVLALMFALSAAHAQTVSQWEALNDACRGAQILPEKNPDCRKRDSTARALIKQGWLPANHEVWISPAQQQWFAQVLRQYDDQARENLYASDSLMPALLISLRMKLHDEQIFAIWNEHRPAIQVYAPFGAALMTTMMQKLALTYARSNDPRYFLGQ